MGTSKGKYCNCLYHSATALARVMSKKADEHFAITGLSSSYALVLMTINDNNGLGPSEIAEEVQLTPSTVTRFLDKMEIKGLISREQCGRNCSVSITEKGKELIPLVQKSWKSLYQDYTETIGKDATLILNTSINSAMEKLS